MKKIVSEEPETSAEYVQFYTKQGLRIALQIQQERLGMGIMNETAKAYDQTCLLLGRAAISLAIENMGKEQKAKK